MMSSGVCSQTAKIESKYNCHEEIQLVEPSGSVDYDCEDIKQINTHPSTPQAPMTRNGTKRD
jgi:hypothetical protein